MRRREQVVLVDVDGILADWLLGFRRLVYEMTQGNAPRDGVYGHLQAKQWDFDPDDLHPGIVNLAWERVQRSDDFWLSLPPIASEREFGLLTCLALHHDVYYATHRAGKAVKAQTELWLERQGIKRPTVLVLPDGSKGETAKVLGAHWSLEDKPGNAIAITWMSPGTQSCLIDRPYNQFDPGVVGSRVKRVQTVGQFVEEVQR